MGRKKIRQRMVLSISFIIKIVYAFTHEFIYQLHLALNLSINLYKLFTMKTPSFKIPDLFWVVLIAAFTVVVHMVTYNTLGFHRDELLYLSLGKHLSAGYWSNPPFIGFVSYLAQLLPGNALFSLRLFPALAGAILIVITGLMTRELGGKRYAQILACISLAISLLFMRAFSMFQPVCFDILFWSLILYFFLRYVNTQKPVFLILVGVAFGFGFLNKYMVIFLAAGLAIAVIPTSYRKLWISRYAWLAVLTAILLLAPNIIWQYTHGFPVFQHMKELRDTQLVNVRRMNMVIDQLLMFTISVLVWFAGLIWLIGSGKAKKFRVFGYTYLAVLVIFLLLRGKSYYMAGLYPVLFAAGGIFWEETLKKKRFTNYFRHNPCFANPSSFAGFYSLNAGSQAGCLLQ